MEYNLTKIPFCRFKSDYLNKNKNIIKQKQKQNLSCPTMRLTCWSRVATRFDQGALTKAPSTTAAIAAMERGCFGLPRRGVDHQVS